MATAPYSNFTQTPQATQDIFKQVWGAEAQNQWNAENAKNYPTAAPQAAVPSGYLPNGQIDPSAGLSNQANVNVANAAAAAAANAINAAKQKADQAYQEALIQSGDKDRAQKAAEFAATQELNRQAQMLAAQNQAYNQGMGVLGLVSSLQGPANAFTQQAVLHGINSSGLSRAVDAINGTVLPSFQGNQATPQGASLQSLISQIYPGATFTGAQPSGMNGVPSIQTIMGSPGGNWVGAPSSTNGAQLDPGAQKTFQVLTAAGSPAAGATPDQFQAFMNANGGRWPSDAWELAAYTKANPQATAMNTTPTGQTNGMVTAPAVQQPFANPATQTQFRQLMGLAPDYSPGTVFTPEQVKASGGYQNAAASGFATFGGSDPLAGMTSGPTGSGTTADYMAALPAPNKINSTNWMQLDEDSKQFLLGAYRQAGYSNGDVLGAVSNTLPKFRAPAVGSIGSFKMPVISTVPRSDIRQDQITQIKQLPTDLPQHERAVVQAAKHAGATPSQLQWAKDNWHSGVVGWCEQFVENALRNAGQAAQRFPSAIAAAVAQKDRMSTNFTDIRPGDPVYYGEAMDNGGLGHAALYAGKDAAGNDLVQSAASPNPTPMRGYFGGALMGFIPLGAQQEQSGPFRLAYRAAEQHGLDPSLFVSQMRAENSTGDPNAISSAGAIGPAQFMPSTAAGFGLTPEAAKDPAKAYDAAARYMVQLRDHFGGDMRSAVAAYNAGPNGNFSNPETTAYVQRVFAGQTGALAGLSGSPGAGGGAAPPASPPGGDRRRESTGNEMLDWIATQPKAAWEIAGRKASDFGSSINKALTSTGNEMLDWINEQPKASWELPKAQPQAPAPTLGVPTLDPEMMPPPSTRYNQQTPEGGFEQVTNYGGGYFANVPAGDPTPQARSAYGAQSAATSGFTTPDPSVPLLALEPPSYTPPPQPAPPPPPPPPMVAGPSLEPSTMQDQSNLEGWRNLVGRAQTNPGYQLGQAIQNPGAAIGDLAGRVSDSGLGRVVAPYIGPAAATSPVGAGLDLMQIMQGSGAPTPERIGAAALPTPIGAAAALAAATAQSGAPTREALGQAFADLPGAFPHTTRALEELVAPIPKAENPLDAARQTLGFTIGERAGGVLGGFGKDAQNRVTQDITADPTASYEQSGLGQSGKVTLPLAGTVPLLGMTIGGILDPANLIPGGKATKATKAAEKLTKKEIAWLAETLAQRMETKDVLPALKRGAGETLSAYRDRLQAMVKMTKPMAERQLGESPEAYAARMGGTAESFPANVKTIGSERGELLLTPEDTAGAESTQRIMDASRPSPTRPIDTGQGGIPRPPEVPVGTYGSEPPPDMGNDRGQQVLDSVRAMFQRNANPERPPLTFGRAGAAIERWWLDKYAPVNKMGSRAMAEITKAEKAGELTAEEAMNLRRHVDAEAFAGTYAGASRAAYEDVVDAFAPVFEKVRGQTWGGVSAKDQLELFLKLQTDVDRLSRRPQAGGAYTPEVVERIGNLKTAVNQARADLEDLLRTESDAKPHPPSVIAQAEKAITDAEDTLYTYIDTKAARPAAGSGESGLRMTSGGVNSVADAVAGLRKLEAEIGPDHFADLQKAEDAIRTVMDDRLRKLVDAGVVPVETAKVLEREFPHYIPVQYSEHLMDRFAGRNNARLVQSDDLLHSLTEQGSPTDTANPLQSAIQSVYNANMALRRQGVGDVLIEAAKLDPKTTARLITSTEPGADQLLARRKATEALEVMQGKRSPVQEAPSEENTLVRFNNGNLEQWQVPRDIAVAAKNLDVLQQGFVEKWIGAINKPLQRGATTYNPAFLAKNAGADAIQTYLIEGLNPYDIARQYRDAATHGPLSRLLTASGGAMESYNMRGGNPLETTRRTDVRNYFRPAVQNQLEAEKRLAGQVERDAGGILLDTPSKVRSAAKALATGEPLRKAGEVVELAPRLATFEKYLAQGYYPERAALMARRVTVDFSRMGTVAKYLNAVSPFLNARIQGSANVFRAAGTRSDTQTRLAVLGGIASGVAVYNTQFPEYADVPDYIKQSSMVLMLPSTENNPDGSPKPRYVALPLRDWAGFIQPINAGVQKLLGQDPDLMKAAWNSVNAFNPIPGETTLSGFGGLMPTVAKLPFEALLNKDFYRGGNIVPEGERNLLPEQQIGTNTSLAAQRLGEARGWSPRMIDFLVKEGLGGGGQTALQAASTLMGQPSDKPPIVGNLVSGLYRSGGGQLLNDAIEARDSGLAALQDQYRPLYHAFAENGDLIQPPRGSVSLGGTTIPLRPTEELAYQQAKVATLQRFMDNSPQLQGMMGNPAIPLEARRAVLEELSTAGGQVALGALLTKLGPDQVRARVIEGLNTPAKPYQIGGPLPGGVAAPAPSARSESTVIAPPVYAR